MVTGASGFLGSEIVRLARTMGWRVRALVRNPQKHVEGVEIIQGDIADSVVLRRACEGVSAVVHAAGLAHVFGPAAKDFARFHAVNAAGTAKLIDAAVEAGVPHIVLVSSVSVYGDYPGMMCDETVPCHPKGSYATSKWQAEIEATERIIAVQASLTILRFATIYGEGDPGNVARLVGALDRSRFIWPGLWTESEKSDLQTGRRACLSSCAGASVIWHNNIQCFGSSCVHERDRVGYLSITWTPCSSLWNFVGSPEGCRVNLLQNGRSGAVRPTVAEIHS